MIKKRRSRLVDPDNATVMMINAKAEDYEELNRQMTRLLRKLEKTGHLNHGYVVKYYLD